MKKPRLDLSSQLIFTLLLISIPFISNSQTLMSIDHLRGGSGNLVRGMYSGETGHTSVCGSYKSDLIAGQGSDETTVLTSGITSGYIAHYNQDVELKFLLGLESSKFGNIESAFVNEVNATYASGNYAGIMDLNPLGDSVEITSTGFSILVSSPDPFLAKYDSLGNLEWHLNPIESGYGYGDAIVPTPSESVIWTGRYDGYMQFEYNGETITYPDPGNTSDAFIFEVDSIGEITKHIRVAGDGDMIVDKGTYDAEGNLYLTGFIQGSVDIETPDEIYTIDTETMNLKFYIIQLTSDWSIGWHVTSDGESGFGRGIAVNSEGDLIFAGYFSGEEYFSSSDGTNTDTIVSVGYRDVFMGKYSTSGNLIEIESIGGPNDEFLSSMSIDEDDQIYLAGSFINSIDFDPSEDSSIIITGDWVPTLFVAKYMSDFNYGWVYYTGSGTGFGADAMGVGILDDGVMLAGNFNYIVDFNPNGDSEEIVSSEGIDGYLVKITNPDITTSIKEIANWKFNLYPNPATDKLTILFDKGIKANQITIYDLMGKAVYQNTISSLFPGESLTLELPKLSPGMYVIGIQGDELITNSFIISDTY